MRAPATCDTCCGSGKATTGPRGVRTPRVACPDCNGTGFESAEDVRQFAGNAWKKAEERVANTPILRRLIRPEDND